MGNSVNKKSAIEQLVVVDQQQQEKKNCVFKKLSKSNVNLSSNASPSTNLSANSNPIGNHFKQVYQKKKAKVYKQQKYRYRFIFYK